MSDTRFDGDKLQELAKALTATTRLQDSAGLAGHGLLQPLAGLRTRSARREQARLTGREGAQSDAVQRQSSLVAALALREQAIVAEYTRRAAPQAQVGEAEAQVGGRITRAGEPLFDAEVLVRIADKPEGAVARTCSGRDGRYVLAVPADAELLFEVREQGRASFRDTQGTAYPPAWRATRDIDIDGAPPVCDPVDRVETPGTETLQMPALVGLLLARAWQAVDALGLKAGQVLEQVSDRAGVVLAQAPAAGAKGPPGTDLTLTVGRDDSRPAAALGELRGKTFSDVLHAMADKEVAVASVTLVAGKGPTPYVRDSRVSDTGQALHLTVAVEDGGEREVDAAALLIGTTPEGLAIGLESGAEAARWLNEAKITALKDLQAAASEDDAVLRKRLGLEARAKLGGPRRVLVTAASLITRG